MVTRDPSNTNPTDHGVQVGGANGAFTSLSVGTNGQVLVGSTGADPSFVTPTTATGLTGTFNSTTHQHALDINSLSADSAPVADTDYMLTYDASASAHKKVLLSNAPRFKAVSFTRDMTTASGDQLITGVGFKPRALLDISCTLQTTGAAAFSINGVADGTTNVCIQFVMGDKGYGNGSKCAYVASTAGSDEQYMNLSSFDSDGFTVTWLKVGSPTGTALINLIAVG